MCIQAGHSMISPEKMCIKVTLRANLSNGNWILSFRYQFLHRCNLWNCFIYEPFIFVAWFGWVGEHQAATFTWPSWKPNILVLIFENTQNQKKKKIKHQIFFNIIGSRISQWYASYNPQTICGSQNFACCFLLNHIMKPDNFLWLWYNSWPRKWKL